VTLTTNMVTVDCVDPAPLVEFWTAALGYSVFRDWGDYILLVPSGGDGLRLGLQRVPEPRVGKNRAHIDFLTEDRAAEVGRLVALGARVLGDGERVIDETRPLRSMWTVMSDPGGNEFCIAQLGP
jgi:hypothetical protein